MQISHLTVVGSNKMHCAGCETTIKFTLKTVPGVESVDADWKAQSIVVSYDPQRADLQRLQQAPSMAGYEVVEVAM